MKFVEKIKTNLEENIILNKLSNLPKEVLEEMSILHSNLNM